MRKLLAVSAMLSLGSLLTVLSHQPADAGAIPPRVIRCRVPARSANTHYVTFRGGETSFARAVGDGDVDMEVYDEGGYWVDGDDLSDWEPECEWFRYRTQVFTIKIVNCEDYPVDYVLRTN